MSWKEIIREKSSKIDKSGCNRIISGKYAKKSKKTQNIKIKIRYREQEKLGIFLRHSPLTFFFVKNTTIDWLYNTYIYVLNDMREVSG